MQYNQYIYFYTIKNVWEWKEKLNEGKVITETIPTEKDGQETMEVRTVYEKTCSFQLTLKCYDLTTYSKKTPETVDTVMKPDI